MNLWLNQSYLHFVKLIYKIYSISMMHIKTGKDNCKEFSRMAGEVLNIEVAQKSILKPSKLCTTNALASLSPQRRTETFQGKQVLSSYITSTIRGVSTIYRRDRTSNSVQDCIRRDFEQEDFGGCSIYPCYDEIASDWR